MTNIQLWWLSLGIFSVVVLVVALLLGAIIATAKSVDHNAAGIWTVGKQIAGNTVAIWMLERTNELLARISTDLQTIEGAAAGIDEKLRALGRAASGRS